MFENTCTIGDLSCNASRLFGYACNCKESKIESDASNHATEAYCDSDEKSPITASETQPDEALINALGTDSIVKNYGLKSWDSEGEYFCKIYNAAYVRQWNLLVDSTNHAGLAIVVGAATRDTNTTVRRPSKY